MTCHSYLSSLALAGCCLVLASGCSREAEVTFAPREDLQAFAPKHQTQLAAGLEEYFGTANSPRFMVVAPDEEQPEDAAEPLLVQQVDRLHLAHGRDVYTRQCAGCHGNTGDGQGPAAPYLDPLPRDYRLGKFKFTSTPRGSKPRREDLARIIRRGAKGTSMPSFRWMSEEDLQAVIDYVVLLSSRGEMEYRVMRVADQELGGKLDMEDATPQEIAEAEKEVPDIDPAIFADEARFVADSWRQADDVIVRPLTPQTPYTEEAVAAGARAFVALNCYKCHGRDGRGNRVQDVGKDDWGHVAYAADLTTGMLHGGRRPVDIYRRIYAGINGTPMPAFAQPDTASGETELQRSETIWNLVHFVTSIVEGKPLPQDVIDEAIREQLKNLETQTQPEAGDTPAPEAPAGDTSTNQPPAPESPPAESPTVAPPTTEPPATETPAAESPAEPPAGEDLQNNAASAEGAPD
jgi:mono/diheme cytochrome c family protein